MAKLKDYAESKLDRLTDYDKQLLEREVVFDLYDTLRYMAQDICNPLMDDQVFSECEWNLFREWYSERGFTEEEWEYVEACGYEREQFENVED